MSHKDHNNYIQLEEVYQILSKGKGETTGL